MASQMKTSEETHLTKFLNVRELLSAYRRSEDTCGFTCTVASKALNIVTTHPDIEVHSASHHGLNNQHQRTRGIQTFDWIWPMCCASVFS